MVLPPLREQVLAVLFDKSECADHVRRPHAGDGSHFL
jgi:hypothetical protein